MRAKEHFYMDWDSAYESCGKQALQITGSATSLYMSNFWGHDENLMYFATTAFPMSGGWGATSDPILLSDGTPGMSLCYQLEFLSQRLLCLLRSGCLYVAPGES